MKANGQQRGRCNYDCKDGCLFLALTSGQRESVFAQILSKTAKGLDISVRDLVQQLLLYNVCVVYCDQNPKDGSYLINPRG